MKVTRHDIPESIENLIQVAIETKVYDVKELYAAAVKFENNFNALVDDICEKAYCQIHWNKDAHKKVVQAAEVVWQKLN